MGYADFLMGVDGPSALGSTGYEVTDTKLACSPQPKHLIQLRVYSRLLGADGLEYLFGFGYTEEGQRSFKALWAHSRAEEKRAFQADRGQLFPT
jgi:predicted RecB family nuclease